MIGCQGLLKLSIDGATNDTFNKGDMMRQLIWSPISAMNMSPMTLKAGTNHKASTGFKPSTNLKVHMDYKAGTNLKVCTDFNIGINF